MRSSGIFHASWLTDCHIFIKFDQMRQTISTYLKLSPCSVCMSGFLIASFQCTLQRSRISKLWDWKELPLTWCPIIQSTVSLINSKTTYSVLQQPGSYCIHLSGFEFFPKGTICHTVAAKSQETPLGLKYWIVVHGQVITTWAVEKECNCNSIKLCWLFLSYIGEILSRNIM